MELRIIKKILVSDFKGFSDVVSIGARNGYSLLDRNTSAEGQRIQ
jgi:hypothetical protein